MPGLVGFTRSLSDERANGILNRMRELIAHLPFHVSDTDFVDKHIAATRVHTDIIERQLQPSSHSGVRVWLDGEIYNADALIRARPSGQSNSCSAAAADLLLHQYLIDPKLSFLCKIDGIYSAVIYDERRKWVHLITDRYGLRHLYWTRLANQLAWGSEVKAFTALPSFSPYIVRESVDDFLRYGYLLENRTWLAGVEVLPPATVLTFNIQDGTVSTVKYWSWQDVPPLPEKVNEGEVTEELGRRFINAVERFSAGDQPVGISLSGGLDSRALLAAMPVTEEGCDTVTFGTPNCDDIRLACMAAAAKGVRHHVVALTAEHWLLDRAAGVWWTDGQVNLMHMHIVVSFAELRRLYAINLNGFSGDAVLGGSYQGDPKWSVTEKVDNRGRRFINEGTRLANNVFHNRLPFFQNELMEFVLSLPDSVKRRSRIYNRMLLQFFPDLFRTIPWQTTGVPISCNASIVRGHNFCSRVQRYAKRKLRRLGIYLVESKNYTDYSAWVRRSPATQKLERLLLDPSPLLAEFVDRATICQHWSEHMAGTDRTELICGYATIEFWLRQLYNNEFRQADTLSIASVSPVRRRA